MASITYPELSSLTSLRAWGDTEKSHNDIAYLLVSAEDEVISDRVYGLSTVWVNPLQARVSTVEDAVRQLTALVSSGSNWPYALVQLNEDTHHVPLPREGHLGVLTEGGTNSATCRQVSQLEVCQLLSSGSQVIYPMGLNGHEAPMIASLPESLARGTMLLGGKLTYLKVSILQPTLEGQEPKAPPHGSHSSPIQMPSLIKVPLPKEEREVSMTMEVRELLSWAVLDMSGHASGNSTPKRLNPMVVLTALPPKLGDLFSPVDTSSQVSTPDDAEMGEASLEEIPTVLSPIAETPRPSSGTPAEDAGHLCKEANKALGELLATKSSINAHQQKLVLDLGMGLHQNKSKTNESIKEAKAVCGTAIKEAKATHVHPTQEAKTHCSMATRDAEAWGASHAGTLQKSHAKSILHPEEQATKEENKSQPDLLPAHQTAP